MRCGFLLFARLVAFPFTGVPFWVVVEVGIVRSCTVDVVGGSVGLKSWLLLFFSNSFVFPAVTQGVVSSFCRLAWLFSSGIVWFVYAVLWFTSSFVCSIPIVSAVALLSVSIKSDLYTSLAGMLSIWFPSCVRFYC